MPNIYWLRRHSTDRFCLRRRRSRNPKRSKIKDSDETDIRFEISSSRSTSWQNLSPNEHSQHSFSSDVQFFASPLASVLSVITSKSIQNQRFRRNGHHIRILLVEIYRLANFEPKRTESTPKFSIIFQFCYSVHLHLSSEIGRKSNVRKKRTPYSESAPQDVQVAKSLRPNGQNQLKFSKVFLFAEVVRFTLNKAFGRILEICAKRCAVKFSIE